jgi:hypothetical protein
MKKDDIVVINDSFGVKHIVRITNIMEIIDDSPTSYGGLVLRSLTKSDLNTINFSDNDIEIKLDNDYDISKIDEDYPELWI